jgi:hypothetical protein
VTATRAILAAGVIAAALIVIAGCGATTTVVERVPGPVVTRIATRTITRTVPAPAVTVTEQAAGYEYDSQDPFWNCWGDMINAAPYSQFCQEHIPN